MTIPNAAALMLALSLAGTPAKPPAQPPSAVSVALPAELSGAGRVLDSFHRALQTGDRTAALGFLSEDALIFESGHSEEKRQYAAHHLDADIAFAGQVPATAMKRKGVLSGQVAWITTEGRTTGTFKGKTVDRRTVETALLRRQAGAWKIVHLHWSSAALK